MTSASPAAARLVVGYVTPAPGDAATLTPMPMISQEQTPRASDAALEQDAGDLGAVDLDVVGPFQPRLDGAARQLGYRLGQRQRRDQRQARDLGHGSRRPQQQGGVQVAGRRLPSAAVAAAAGRLLLRPDEQALGLALVGQLARDVVGAADRTELEQAEAVPERRAGHGARAVAAARAELSSGEAMNGTMKNSSSAAHTPATALTAPDRAQGRTPRPARRSTSA